MLVLVFNYTGDRLNFGLATEQARREGGKVGLGGQGARVARGAWKGQVASCVQGCSVESVGVDVL